MAMLVAGPARRPRPSPLTELTRYTVRLGWAVTIICSVISLAEVMLG